MRKTSRGFNIYTEITDTYGSKVRVQESSSINKRCWIFCHNETSSKAEDKSFTPHLDVAQAKEIIKGLQKFIKGV